MLPSGPVQHIGLSYRSARLGIDFWALYRVYKYGLRVSSALSFIGGVHIDARALHVPNCYGLAKIARLSQRRGVNSSFKWFLPVFATRKERAGGGGYQHPVPVMLYTHRVHRVATAAFWRAFHYEGKISPGWWGWGVHAHPLSLHLPSPVKLQCTLQLSE